MTKLSGDQKLRIVLESIIRGIPKEEQCKKYQIGEEEFQSWHDKLIRDGGKIYDSNSSRKVTKISKHRKAGPVTKVFFSLSIALNLVLLFFWGLEQIEARKKPEQSVSSSILTNNTASKPSLSRIEEIEKSLISETEITSGRVNEVLNELTTETKPLNLEPLITDPLSLPESSLLEPVVPPDLSSEVTFYNQVYQGRHVVYLLDVGLYVLEGEGAVQRFEKAKDVLLASIKGLSPNSYFNLVLFWNLREVSALGKTILRASKENKKYALDWITGLGPSPKALKENRFQFYPKELLYAKPLPGIVGPWYGLATAVSFDPDLVFVLCGNLPTFSPEEVPRAHYQGLGLEGGFYMGVSDSQLASVSIGPLMRQTALKWFDSMQTSESFYENSSEEEEIALKRLGFSDGRSKKLQDSSIPWEKAFENFLVGLEVGFDQIPKTHFFLSLPPYINWPSSLTNTVREFSESSNGSFLLNPEFP